MNLPLPFRIFNGIAVLLFAAFAFFQYNDIDPTVYHRASSLDAALWLGFYALIAILFAFSLFQKAAPRWLLFDGSPFGEERLFSAEASIHSLAGSLSRKSR